MPVQTAYSENIRPAVAGTLANTEPSVLISRTVENADGVAFGFPVARGTSDNGVIASTTGVTAILGITVRERSVRPEAPNKFAQYESARIAIKGVVWVNASVAVNDGDPVYVTVATGALVKAAGAGNVQIANAVWDSSTSWSGLAKVRLA